MQVPNHMPEDRDEAEAVTKDCVRRDYEKRMLPKSGRVREVESQRLPPGAVCEKTA